MTRIRGILQDADVKLILTEARFIALIEGWLRLERLNGITCFALDALELNDKEAYVPIDKASPAVLQYTSGSTGDPKGVVVNHESLMHNMDYIKRKFQNGPDTIIANWLPIFHDMGLFGNVFQPLYLGRFAVHMSPTTFLKRPATWLRAISDYKATTSGAPNFAYDYCVRSVKEDQIVDLDLSSWKAAFNGSEPVRFETLKAFSKRFAPHGFDRKAFFPCYGLAESTLFVTGAVVGKGPTIRTFSGEALANGVAQITKVNTAGARKLVSSGSASDLQVAVVNPDTLIRVPDQHVGEIWIRGKSVASGYWRKKALSASVYGAELESQAGWLRTGDLGFLLNGELFVTGRIKETIVINGRNLYPHDIERSVQNSHSAFRIGGGAVFSVDGRDGEAVVVVQELLREGSGSGKWSELARALRETLAREFGVRVGALVFVKASTIQKTTSGKIMRRKMKELFLRRAIKSLYEEIEPSVW